MPFDRCVRHALAVGAAFASVACAAPSLISSPPSVLASGASSVQGYGLRLGRRAGRAGSSDLIYAGASDGKHIYIISYPQGKPVRGFAPPVGTISLQGLCSDTSGNVYVTSVSKGSGSSGPEGYLYEYAHGGKKVLKTLNFYRARPFGCAVDPSSGTLAVSAGGFGSRSGTLETYAPGSGNGKTYYSYEINNFYYCAYDGSGDLFVNGQGNGTQMYLNELPSGKQQLSPISLNTYVSVSGMGQLQWDGTHLALEDLTDDAIYQLSLSGSQATVVGKTRLYGWNGFGLSAIAGKNVIVPMGVSQTGLGIWKYSAGGKAVKNLSSPSVFGLAISAAGQ
jgi:hypothetical protein